MLSLLLGGAAVVAPSPASAAQRPAVSVQPVEGAKGAAQVRRIVARTVRARGLRVTTEIPKAAGTGQYYTWARELGLRAFVTGELVQLSRKRQRATFLVWSGHDGAVVGRWSVTAPERLLPKAVARGFWPRLGRSFKRAHVPPEWREYGPGPTQRIDAGFAQDESITGYHAGRRRLR